VKEVPDPERFGVATFTTTGRSDPAGRTSLQSQKIIKITEKPKNPDSNYAVTGIYMYDKTVFTIIKTLKPSSRGELEITDVNNHYIRQKTLEYDILDGYWTDAGTFESLFRAGELVHQASL
jgi:glucose-1-phosphate thymidylyltransferase